MRQRSESGRCQGKWIPGKRAINHYQDEISAETKKRTTKRKIQGKTIGKRLPGKMARTPLVINKFSLKGVQDHATYLPGWVCKYIFGLSPPIFR